MRMKDRKRQSDVGHGGQQEQHARRAMRAWRGAVVLVGIIVWIETVAGAPWVYEMQSTSSDVVNEACCIAYRADRLRAQVVVVGWTNSNAGSGSANQGGTDAFVVFLDESTGNVVRSLLIGTPGNEVAHSVVYDKDNAQVVVLGSTTGTFPGQQNFGGQDLFVSVINDNFEITTLQYGSAGQDDPVQVILYSQLGYIAVGSGRTQEVTAEGQPNAMVVVHITTAGAVARRETITMAEGQFAYFSAYAVEYRTGSGVFAVTFELSEIPEGDQLYYMAEFDESFNEVFRIELRRAVGISDAFAFEPSNIKWSSSSETYWISGIDPGYGNPYHIVRFPSPVGGAAYLIGRVTPATGNQFFGPSPPSQRPNISTMTSLQVYETGERYIASRVIFEEEELDDDTLVEIRKVSWQSTTYEGTDRQAATVRSGLAYDNWNLGNTAPVDESTGLFMIVGDRWNQFENPYNCMGTSERRNISFAVGSFDEVMAVADFGSQCSEVGIDVVQGASASSTISVYYGIGTTAGSVTGQARNNFGSGNTVIATRVEYDSSQPFASRLSAFVVTDPVCELPCSSLAPPTPSPTPTPTTTLRPTPTPSWSPSPTPTIPTPTPSPTITPTLGPLPKDDPPSWGMVIGIAVGAIAASALVIGLCAFIFYMVAVRGAQQAAEDGYYY